MDLLKRPLAAIALSCLLAPPVAGATLTATPTTLLTTWAAAKAGDTIKMVGTFGHVSLSSRTFTTTVHLDASQAVFNDGMVLTAINGLSMTGGTFHVTTSGNPYVHAITVNRSTGIAFSKVAVTGDGLGQGIAFENSQNISVMASTFTNLKAGVTLTSVSSGLISGNKSVRASSDGFDVADSHKITVSANSCSATVPGPGFHPDCVQLWSIAGNPVQSDIIVSGNTATGATQGFTAFNATDGGGLRYQLINNIVNTSYSQGVACYSCVDSIISGNQLTTLAGAPFQTTINIVGGSNNIVSHNTIGAGGGHPANRTFYSGILPDGDTGGAGLAGGLGLAGTIDDDGTDTAFPQLAYDEAIPPEMLIDDGDFTDTSAGTTDEAPATGQFAALAVSNPAAVPEPAVWLQLITGMGLAGTLLRRRRQVAR